MRERSRSQTVVKNYRHQLRHHPESEMNQRTVPWSTGNTITILNDVDNKYLKYTGPHEMGHSLGLVHESTGLMTAEASNELRNENIYKSQIKSIVRNSYSGIPNEENGYSAGRGHFIPTNGKMPTTPKFKIKKL